MNAILQRLRWRLVEILDRRADYCWTDLVQWATGNGERVPRRSIRSCQEDADRKGSCWCYKLRNDGAAQRWYDEHSEAGWYLDGEPVQRTDGAT